MVTNVRYLEEIREGFMPTEEDMEELAHIAKYGMGNDNVLDELDEYFLGVAQKHHGDFPGDEE